MLVIIMDRTEKVKRFFQALINDIAQDTNVNFSFFLAKVRQYP